MRVPATEDEKADVVFPKYDYLKVRSFVDGNERNGKFYKSAAFAWLSTPYAVGSDVFAYVEDSLPSEWNAAKVISSKVTDEGELEYVIKESGDAEPRTVSYVHVAPAKLADLLPSEWQEFQAGIHTEVAGTTVMHLNKTLSIDTELYGFMGVAPIVLHFLNAQGDAPEHPWLTLFEVNPYAEVGDGAMEKKPKPFCNALYYSPGFEGKSGAEIRIEARDKPTDALQFAAGSLNRFLEQNPLLAAAIAKREDMYTGVFAQKKVASGDAEITTYERAKIVAHNVMTNKWAVKFAKSTLKEDGVTEVWKEEGAAIELPVLPTSFAPAIWTDPSSGSVLPCVPQKLVEATGEYHVQLLSGFDKEKEDGVKIVKKSEVLTVPGLQVPLEYQRLSHNCTIA